MVIFHLFPSKCFALQKIYRLPDSQPRAFLREQNWLLRAEIQTSHSRSDLLAELPHAAAPCLALAGKVQRNEGEWREARQQERGGWRGARWRSSGTKRASLKAGKGSSSPWLLRAAKNCLESRRGWRGAFLRACAWADWSQKHQHQSSSGGFVCWVPWPWSPDSPGPGSFPWWSPHSSFSIRNPTF